MNSGTVVAIDTTRMRRGMRALAHQIVTRMTCPTNRDLWFPLEKPDPHRVTPEEIKATLGSLTEFWQASDVDASSRIIHMSILVLHSVHTGQYRDSEMLGEAMQAQSAAEAVRLRLDAPGETGSEDLTSA